MFTWLLRRLVSRFGKSSAAPPAPEAICFCLALEPDIDTALSLAADIDFTLSLEACSCD